jgi:hypothetical protein
LATHPGPLVTFKNRQTMRLLRSIAGALMSALAGWSDGLRPVPTQTYTLKMPPDWGRRWEPPQFRAPRPSREKRRSMKTACQILARYRRPNLEFRSCAAEKRGAK